METPDPIIHACVVSFAFPSIHFPPVFIHSFIESLSFHHFTLSHHAHFSFIVVPSVFLLSISSLPAFLPHGWNCENKVSPFSLRGVGCPYCYWSLFLPQV